MFKKALTLALVSALLVGVMVAPTSAATGVVWLDYMDYTTKVTTSGSNDICTVEFPLNFCGIKVRAINADGTAFVAGRSTPGDSTPNIVLDLNSNISHYSIMFGLDINHKLWTENIPSGIDCTVSATVGMPQGGAHSVPYNRFVETTVTEDDRYINDYIKTFEQQEVAGTHAVTWEFTSDDFGCWVGLDLAYFEVPSNDTFEFTLTDFKLTLTIPTAYREDWVNQEQSTLMAKNNVLLLNQETMLDDMESQQEITNEKLDKIPGEIGNEMQEVADSEKQEASESGDSNVGAVLEVIPDDSAGFMDALQSFASSMSYSGTDATLTIPAISLPSVAGLPSATILKEQSIEISKYISVIPDNILLLVRSLLTIALIIYCFKELYDTISYVMTLRKGSD